MNVLVVAAHPDDELLGVGGTILRHVAAGDLVSVYIACTGTNLRYGDAQSAALHETAQHVGSLIGSVVRLGDFPDQALDTSPLPRIVAALVQEIEASDPELAYVHHWGDLNRDHRILCEALAVAARPYSAPRLRAVRCFETPSSTEWGAATGLAAFVPNLFVDIETTLQAKIDAFAEYESEVRASPHPRSLEALEVRARAWGAISGLEAAEAFVVVRDRW